MWERIFGALSAPGKTLHKAAEMELWKEGLFIVAVVAILNGLSEMVAPGSLETLQYLEESLNFPLAETPLTSPGFGLFSSLFGGLLGWFVVGAVFFFVAKIFKGQGSFIGMLASLGYANCPYFIGAPLAAITSVAGSFGTTLSGIIGFAVGIWVLVLNIIAIRESQQISTGAAAATYFIPVILFIILLILLGVLIAMAIFTSAPLM
jgi:hypothetical protein